MLALLLLVHSQTMIDLQFNTKLTIRCKNLYFWFARVSNSWFSF